MEAATSSTKNLDPMELEKTGEDAVLLDISSTHRILCTQLPCFVKDLKRATSKIGGEAALRSNIESASSRVSFRMQPDAPGKDPLRVALAGELRRAQGVLVKLVRRTVTDRNGNVVSSELIKADPVGKVEECYQFLKPYDFQVFWIPFLSCLDLMVSIWFSLLLEPIP